MEYNNENLLKLDAQGLSYKQIAAALHVTTSAVGGKLRRIKARDPSLVFVRKKEEKKTVVKKVKTLVTTVRVPPNSNTWAFGGRKKVELSKAQMYAQLKQAVENTK